MKGANVVLIYYELFHFIDNDNDYGGVTYLKLAFILFI